MEKNAYIVLNNITTMEEENTTVRLTLTTEDKHMANEKTVEIQTNDPLSFTEFMELTEALITSMKEYSKHEIESYIEEWAHDIRASKEN